MLQCGDAEAPSKSSFIPLTATVHHEAVNISRCARVRAIMCASEDVHSSQLFKAFIYPAHDFHAGATIVIGALPRPGLLKVAGPAVLRDAPYDSPCWLSTMQRG